MMAAINISSSLKEVSKWLEFLVLVLLGAQYIRTRRQVWTIIVLVCVAGITQAMYGYFQAFFNLGPEAFIRDTSLRVYGTFGQPNPFAGYINLPLSIALALMLLGSNWRTRLLAGLSAILLAGAEYLTQSRGGEIAIATCLTQCLRYQDAAFRNFLARRARYPKFRRKSAAASLRFQDAGWAWAGGVVSLPKLGSLSVVLGLPGFTCS